MGLFQFMIMSQMPSRKGRPALRALDLMNWRAQARAKREAEQGDLQESYHDDMAYDLRDQGSAAEPAEEGGFWDFLPWKKANYDDRPAKRVPRPELGLRDIFRLSAVDREGKPLRLRDRFRHGDAIGRYAVQSLGDKLTSFAGWVKGLADRRGRRLGKKFFKDMDEMDDGVNRSEINNDPELGGGAAEAGLDGDGKTKSGKEAGFDAASEYEFDKPTFSRMDDGTSREIGALRRGIRVRFTPDMPENRLASNHVGPERQVTRSNDPWPLDKPSQKEAGSEIKLIGSDDAGSAMKPAETKQVKGPEARPALESPEALQKRSGKAAADKGAARAREIVAGKKAEPKTKSETKSKSRKGAEQEM